MSKAAEEEKPGAEYPGDSSGNTHQTIYMIHDMSNSDTLLTHMQSWDKCEIICVEKQFPFMFSS